MLKALGHKIVPGGLRILSVIPASLLAFLFRLLVNSRFFEVGGIYHAQQAPDELQALADDLRAAVIRSGAPAPAIRKAVRNEVARGFFQLSFRSIPRTGVSGRFT